MTAVFNFLMIVGVIQGFVFNIVTFLSRKQIEKPVLFLNLFVFFLSLNNLQSWLIDKSLITSNYYTLPWYVLLAPMFYTFLIYYLGIEKKRRTYFVLTGAIFLLELTARSIVIWIVRKSNLDEGYMQLYNAIEDAITLLFSLFLFYRILRILFKYKELYSTILTFDNLKWIKRFIQLGAVVLILWGIAVLLNLVSDTIKPPYSYYPLRLSTSILIYWIGYQGFFRYVVLQDRIILRGAIKKMKLEEEETPTIILDSKGNGKQEEVFNVINDYILTNQEYLDPYLSMEKLSKDLNMGVSNLSKVVNQYAGSNFPDYINKLRVKEAKKLLANNNFASYTIVAIGLECGFNSKSTFYTAFKKFTGQTPTQYQKQHS